MHSWKARWLKANIKMGHIHNNNTKSYHYKNIHSLVIVALAKKIVHMQSKWLASEEEKHYACLLPLLQQNFSNLHTENILLQLISLSNVFSKYTSSIFYWRRSNWKSASLCFPKQSITLKKKENVEDVTIMLMTKHLWITK